MSHSRVRVAMMLAALLVGVVPLASAAAAVDTAPTVTRLEGPNRFATAVAVSQKMYPGGAERVYIATGYNFPDALAAGGGLQGPILLTNTDSLPGNINTEIKRLKPAEVYVIGGTSAVSDAVLNQLKAAGTWTVTRLQGANRFATAVAVSQKMYPGGAERVYIATGYNFPDALAAGGGLQGPILLTNTDSLPGNINNEIKRLKPAEVFVIGGTSAVSDTVMDEIRTALGIGTGASRILIGSRPGSDRTLNELFIIDPSSSAAPKQVTSNSLAENSAGFSPDGSKIAFTTIDASGAGAGFTGDFFVMSADGSNVIQIPTGALESVSGWTWAPDSSRIVYMLDQWASDGSVVGSQIYVVGADGSNRTQLTTGAFDEINPAWSPDGSKIAFMRLPQAGSDIFQIYTMAIDGTNVTKISSSAVRNEHNPRWSPDGSKIAYFVVKNTNFGTEWIRIYVMDADGANATELGGPRLFNMSPSWSPDGSKIGFVSATADNLIENGYTMNADGTNIKKLVANPNDLTTGPTWSPDGAKIAFTAYRWDSAGGRVATDIRSYTTNVNGTGLTKLTDKPSASVLSWVSVP